MSTRKFIKKLTASLLFIAVVMSFGVQSAFAESNSPKATVKNNVVTFSNLDQLKANEKLAIAVVDSNGDPATITIESVDNSISRVAKSSNSWKVSYKGVIRQTCITICGTQSCNRIVPCICDFVIRHCHIKICMNHHSLIRNLPRIRRFRYTRN